jgi:guanylate kinase
MENKVLGQAKKGLVFVISAPSGTGKSTLVEKLVNEYPNQIVESCSCTTRPPRLLEKPDVHYHFMTVEQFEGHIERGDFIEYAKVFGNYYGTLQSEIENHQRAGKHVMVVIDTQGAMQIKKKIEASFIFISPPSVEALADRLFKRMTEDEASMAKRLAWAKEELKMIPHYDYHIVNDQIEDAYQILKSIIIAEEHRRKDVT